MKPLVTIVIPTYNSADYLDAAIQSVLSQTYSRIELIVLDDGSTDQTPLLLKKYEGRLFTGRHENMGQANTLNKGWTMAKGELLSYLSADDVLLPTAVEDAVNVLKTAPSVILTYCDYHLIDDASRFIRKVKTHEYAYFDLAVKLICQPGPGIFFRREIFERCGGWHGRFRQMPDFEYWLRIGLEGDFRRIPNVGALYRIHDRSQTFALLDELRANEPVHIIETYFAEAQGIPPSVLNSKNRALSNAYLLSARLHLRSNRFGKGFFMLFKAFRLYPAHLLAVRTFRLLGNALTNRALHAAIRKLRAKRSA